MYSKNNFDIVKPTDDMAPQPDFSVPLFQSGYQHFLTRLDVRVRTFYDLHWLLNGGYDFVKNYYRGLTTLTLILEPDSATKGFRPPMGQRAKREVDCLHQAPARQTY